MIKKIYFNDFADFCSLVEKNSSRIFKTNELAKFFEDLTPVQIKIIIYCFQNTLGPIFNTPVLGISESLLKKWILNFFNMGSEEFEDLIRKYGDIGIVASKKKEDLGIFFEKKIEIEYFWERILAIANTEGKGSQKKREEIFFEVFEKLDIASSLYFLRILEGNFRIGISEKTIIDSLSQILKKKLNFNLVDKLNFAYSIYPDLGFLGEKVLKQNSEDLSWLFDIKINVGTPIFPQAAERVKSLNEIDFEKSKLIYIQPKYDGLRLQIHYDEGKIYSFSRNLLPMNNMFPEIENFFKKICDLKGIKKVILDGEILVYDQENLTYGSFQKTIERRRKYEIEKYNNTHPVHYVIFDILSFNDESLLYHTYKDRIEKINSIFEKNYDNKIYPVNNYLAENFMEAINIHKKYEKMDYEGIMIKDPNSKYSPGERNKSWLKLKKIQKGTISDTIDVVVIGYYFPRGKRLKQGIGAILTAVYNDENDSYESVAKIGTGLVEEKWIDLEKNLSKISSKEKPNNVNVLKSPDVWCFPKVVVSLEADSISNSNDYYCGFSFRFPRLKDIVYDKNPEQANTKNELILLQKNN